LPLNSARAARGANAVGMATSGSTTTLSHGTISPAVSPARRCATRGGSYSGLCQSTTRARSAADSARSPEPSSVQAANVTSCLAAHNGMVRRMTCWIPVCRSCRAVWSTSTTTPCWTNSMARVADTEELSARLSSSSQRLVSRLVEISNRRRNARTSLAVAMRPATARRSSHSLAGVVSERTWSISPRSTAAASCIGSSSRCGNSGPRRAAPTTRSRWARAWRAAEGSTRLIIATRSARAPARAAGRGIASRAP